MGICYNISTFRVDKTGSRAHSLNSKGRTCLACCNDDTIFQWRSETIVAQSLSWYYLKPIVTTAGEAASAASAIKFLLRTSFKFFIWCPLWWSESLLITSQCEILSRLLGRFDEISRIDKPAPAVTNSFTNLQFTFLDHTAFIAKELLRKKRTLGCRLVVSQLHSCDKFGIEITINERFWTVTSNSHGIPCWRSGVDSDQTNSLYNLCLRNKC